MHCTGNHGSIGLQPFEVTFNHRIVDISSAYYNYELKKKHILIFMNQIAKMFRKQIFLSGQIKGAVVGSMSMLDQGPR